MSTPLSGTVLWTDPATGSQWAVTVSWQEQGGVPTPVGVQLSSWRSANSSTLELPEYTAEVDLPRVDGTVLRRLPLAQLAQESRARVAEIMSSVAESSRRSAARLDALPPEVRAQMPADLFDPTAQRLAADTLERFAHAYEDRPRGGRDLGDAHYAEVAAVYRQAVVDGRPPTKAVEDHFQVAKSSAAKKVARARERGFLPANPGKGRIGRLTDGGQQ